MDALDFAAARRGHGAGRLDDFAHLRSRLRPGRDLAHHCRRRLRHKRICLSRRNGHHGATTASESFELLNHLRGRSRRQFVAHSTLRGNRSGLWYPAALRCAGRVALRGAAAGLSLAESVE